MLASITAVGLVAALSGPAGAPLLPDSTHRAALQASLEAFSRAFVVADVAALDSLLAADYVHTNGGSASVLTREAWLAYIRTRRAELQSGALRVSRHETEGLSIRWYPDVAVVTSRVLSEGTHNGAAFRSHLQVTQVWIRRGTRWLRAAFHDSPVPAP